MAGTGTGTEQEDPPPPAPLPAKAIADGDNSNTEDEDNDDNDERRSFIMDGNDEASIRDRRLVGGACRKDPTYGLFFRIAAPNLLPIRTDAPCCC